MGNQPGRVRWKRDNSVMMSSVMPSLKYCCPGSPLMLVKGRTAVESLSDFASSRGGKNGGEAAPNTLDGHSKAFNVDSRIPS